MTEGKTFNDLAEEYQWSPTLDAEHIFEGEKNLIQEVKKLVPEVENETDKFVLVFLIARRHNVEETVKLLQKFTKLQQEKAVSSKNPPSMTFTPELVDLRTKAPVPYMQPLEARDVHDRMLRYFFMALEDPTIRDAHTTHLLFLWQTYYYIQMEPLNAWRNGLCVVVDMKDFGWKNLDTSSKGRALNKQMQSTFPFRFRAMLVVNGGSLVNGVVTAAKLVMPKKIMSRVAIVDADKLKDTIPPKFLLKRYEGGEFDMEIDKSMQNTLENEAKLFASDVWKK